MIDLRQGDCLELMKDIPDKSIDLIVTDPPYLHIKGGCKSKRLNVGCRNVNSNVVNNMSDFGEQQIYTYLDNVKKKMKELLLKYGSEIIVNTFSDKEYLQRPENRFTFENQKQATKEVTGEELTLEEFMEKVDK